MAGHDTALSVPQVITIELIYDQHFPVRFGAGMGF